MYCTKCGKENKDNSKFCANCGAKNESISENVDININFDVTSIFKKIGSVTFLKLLSLVTSVLAIIIRVVNNEVKTEFSFLTQEDYYIMGEKGISEILILATVHLVLCLFAINQHNKTNANKKRFIWSFFPLVLCALVNITFPAPY